MILMGDEMRHTQFGNNERLLSGQRNELARLTLADSHADVLRFVQLLSARRLPREETEWESEAPV